MADQRPTGSPPPGTPPPFDAGQAVLRLLVGLTLEGADELERRLRRWEYTTYRRGDPAAGTSTPRVETDDERIRYALIGLLFTLEHRAERDLARWLLAPGQAMTAWVESIDKAARNPLLRPLIRPLADRAALMQQQIDAEVERWIAIGVREEARARALGRTAAPEVVSEVIGRLAENEDIQRLIQQQSLGMTQEVVDSVREVTVTGDALLEKIARKLVRRKPRPITMTTSPDVYLLSDDNDR